MKAIFGVCLAALFLAGCQTGGPKPGTLTREQFDAPIRPGQTRLALENPDTEKWTVHRLDSGSTARTVFICRPLACAAPSVVTYARIVSPTRKPDREALQALAIANTDSMKADGWAIVSAARVSTHRGFPSTHHVLRKEIDGKMEYSHYTAVFPGNLAFSISSRSANSDVARRNLELFLNAVEIKDGGPRPRS
ncbi:MAG: hypothetical protein IOB85_08380 [Methylobacterium sp.]|nr:hypothetical protein [Methylobacterium sp.]MCA3656789.1 hypothetical protein [Methylobacterium sp.]MCA3665965.1 hypothetical protein [Methylobacterium sp.]MCA3669977.1 hypothetical protein [Methylobacterium sp.]MCA3672818.1 hypothetical protein [Methylobacterium sp.]